MNNVSSHLVIYLVGGAAIFVILFGIRGSASIINPILLAAVITITVLPVPSRLTKRGMPGWLALVLSILMVVLLLGLVIATVFFSVTKLSTELPTYMASASQQASADLSATADSETSTQIEQVTISIGPVVQGLLASVINLLVQFGLALVIFFFMISAALALPAPSRLGLDPDQPVIGRVTRSNRRCAQVYDRPDRGQLFGGPGRYHFSLVPGGGLSPCCGGCWPGSWGISPRLAS